jgi:ornithine carbamoyltransferase
MTTTEPRTTVWPPDLLRVGDLTSISIGELLDLATEMKRETAGWKDALAGQTLACFLDPPTTGMAAAVATAADRLGMLPVPLPRDELQLATGEPLPDIARTFSASAAALFTHAFRHAMLTEVAKAATAPVINNLSDEHRPCQALADLLTLRERFGSLEGLALAFVGNGGDSVAHSLMEAGALCAMDVRVACPPDLPPSPGIRIGAETFAELNGGSLTVTEDAREAVQGANAVYTSPWVLPGRERQREERRAQLLRRYQVHVPLMRLAKPSAVFMHCLPARRGEEVAAQVVDGKRSVVWHQAANRVPTLQAVLYALVSSNRP